jgi:hypothetical protein
MNDTDRATALAHLQKIDAAAVAAKNALNDAQRALWRAEDAEREAWRLAVNARYEYQQKYGDIP